MTQCANENGAYVAKNNHLNDWFITFQNYNNGCNSCTDSVVHKRQCQHKICLMELRFHLSLWTVRHMKRTQLIGSLRGWMHSSNISAIEILVVVEGIKITPLDMELIQPNKGMKMSVKQMKPSSSAPEIDQGPDNDQVDHPYDMTSNRCCVLAMSVCLENTIRGFIVQ